MSFSFTVLGCDGSYPGPGGAGSGYLLEAAGKALWIDTGPGTMGALQRERSLASLDAVVVTHEHPDHTGDLNGLAVAMRLVPGSPRLAVYAPLGVRESLYCGKWDVFDWHQIDDGDRVELGDLVLSFSRTDHGPRTLALRADAEGTSLGYSADTGPGWSLEALGSGLDLACCEATWTAANEGMGGHMSGRQAGASARAAGAARLLLTHRWPTVAEFAVGDEAAEAYGAPVLHARTGSRYLLEVDSARADGRLADDLRQVRLERDFTEMAMGSVLVHSGRTRVLCTASVEERIPPWLRGKGRGWVTAEYSLLPGGTPERAGREAVKGRQSGRTQEIQRLIGRSLRAVCDLTALGEVQIVLDCDVLQADGGTRTAAVCGAYVALHDACSRMLAAGQISRHPMTEACAAVSVGIVDGTCLLDLDYSEDVRAEVDMNVVMTSGGRFVEVQGTAEGKAFSRSELDELLSLAEHGIAQLLDHQREVLASAPPPRK